MQTMRSIFDEAEATGTLDQVPSLVVSYLEPPKRTGLDLLFLRSQLSEGTVERAVAAVNLLGLLVPHWIHVSVLEREFAFADARYEAEIRDAIETVRSLRTL